MKVVLSFFSQPNTLPQVVFLFDGSPNESRLIFEVLIVHVFANEFVEFRF